MGMPMPSRHHDEAQGDTPTDARTVRIGEHVCRVLCVDEVIPRHVVEGRRDARPRLLYAEGEVTHFEIGEHRYALVLEEAPDAQPQAPHDTLQALLTNRELQIVQFVCLGYLTKQIADRLHLSEFTVRSYLKTIYCKLGVRSRAAMVFRYTQAFGASKALP
jgi:DNA-binding NarL/FixJ family response regulator